MYQTNDKMIPDMPIIRLIVYYQHFAAEQCLLDGNEGVQERPHVPKVIGQFANLLFIVFK